MSAGTLELDDGALLDQLAVLDVDDGVERWAKNGKGDLGLFVDFGIHGRSEPIRSFAGAIELEPGAGQALDRSFWIASLRLVVTPGEQQILKCLFEYRVEHAVESSRPLAAIGANSVSPDLDHAAHRSRAGR